MLPRGSSQIAEKKVIKDALEEKLCGYNLV